MPRALLPLSVIRQAAFLYGPDLAVVETNDLAEALAGRSLVGCSAEEVARIFGARHADGTPLGPAELGPSRALAGEAVLEVPLSVTAADGRTLDVLVTASPVRDGDAPAGVLVLWQDVTERNRTARALAASDSLFSTAFAAMPFGLILGDPDGRILRSNPAIERMLGYTSDELHGMSFAEITHPLDLQAELPLIERVRAGGTDRYEIEKRYLRRDGRPIWVRLIGAAIRDGDGVPEMAIAIVEDVTARKETDQACAEQHELLERLIEAVPVMISIHDPALGRFHLNRAVEEILGYTDEDAADGRLLERTYPDPAYRATVEAFMRSLDPGWRDMTVTARDGSAVPTSWANFRLSTEVEVGVGIDLRERTKMEAALLESEAKYRNLVELAPDAILIHQDGTIVFANAAAAALLGAGAPDALFGRRILEFVHPDSRAYVEANIAADLRGEESPLTPIEMVRLDGTIVSTQGRGAMIPFGGRPALQVVLRDVTEEKRAEAALRESEERLSLAQSCAGVGVWEWIPTTDPGGGPLDFIRVYEEPPSGFRPFDWRGTVHPDDLDRVEAVLEASLALGEPFELEFRARPGPETSGWMRVLGSGVYDGAGELVRVLGVSMDITGQKKVEAALQESERRHAFLVALGDRLREIGDTGEITAVASELLGCLLGASGVVYGEVDAAGEVVTVRGGWSDGTVPRAAGSFRLDDLGVGDLLRRGQVRESDLGPPPTRRAAAIYRDLGIRALVAAPVCRGGRLAAVLAVYASSPRAWTDAEVGLVREAGDRVWAALARVRAEGALRRRERTLAGIFRAAPVGIGVVSYRVITQANDQLCRMTGYSREELIGHDARIFYPSDEAYDYVGREKYRQMMADGVGAVETQWRRKDGTVRDILLSSSPLDPGDPRENVVFNALDITRLRESERALETYMDDLERSNEELQRFAYVASHDLQEPLRSIISFSQLLERRYRGKLDTDADDYIGFIIDGGVRMQQLILDLLQLSRVETKAKPLVPTDAGEVVADALRMMETAIGEAGATVTVGPMPRVMADAAQLAQVFTNLVGNALKYRRPDLPPELGISARRTDGMWEFAVQDNGIGIEAEYFDRIFVIFQRLHTRDEYEGTGIGLAVVRKIVERHGGRVRVESMPGEGSTFFFTLPAA